eukprot:6259236-Ditylum_brightwellii.AAC.1
MSSAVTQTTKTASPSMRTLLEPQLTRPGRRPTTAKCRTASWCTPAHRRPATLAKDCRLVTRAPLACSRTKSSF